MIGNEIVPSPNGRTKWVHGNEGQRGYPCELYCESPIAALSSRTRRIRITYVNVHSGIEFPMLMKSTRRHPYGDWQSLGNVPGVLELDFQFFPDDHGTRRLLVLYH